MSEGVNDTSRIYISDEGAVTIFMGMTLITSIMISRWRLSVSRRRHDVVSLYRRQLPMLSRFGGVVFTELDYRHRPLAAPAVYAGARLPPRSARRQYQPAVNRRSRNRHNVVSGLKIAPSL